MALATTQADWFQFRRRLIRAQGSSPAGLLVEAAVVLAVYFGYSATKGLIHSAPYTTALGNAWRVVVLELNLKLFHEETLQRFFLGNAELAVQAFNWFYTLGYWPVILPVAIYAWWRHPAVYRDFRNVALILMLLALVAYALFPLAPPRMLSGFVDTIQAPNNTAFGHASYALYSNEYAAMPSVHYALALLIALLLVRIGNRWVKAIAFAYQAMMLLTIVVTANHYFLDAIVAVGVLSLAWAIYWALGRTRVERSTPQSANLAPGT